MSTEREPEYPNAARIYDYFLGGHHHFAVDRQIGEYAVNMAPFIPGLIRMQHACLKDVARELTARGFDILIDFASGLPTEGNLHHHVPQGTTVIYADIDQEVVRYSKEILGNTSNVLYMQSDIHNPLGLLESSEVQQVLQGRRDVAFITWGIALYMKDEEIGRLARTLYDWSDARACWAFNVPLAGANPNDPAMAQFLAAYEQMGEPLYTRPTEGLESLVAPWRVDGAFVSLMDWHQAPPEALPAAHRASVGDGGGSAGAFLVK